MTLRDEHRTTCFEAMFRAYEKATGHIPDWNGLMAAFDALRTAGARVVPAEATVEMIRAGLKVRPTARETWDAMSAAGDLCNPPEEKS